MDFEIGHINFSVKSELDTRKEREEIETQKRLFNEDEGIAGCPWEDDKPVVGWHNDSYPFVCVLMLSDCTGMVGGETALRTGNGDILKVRGPQRVSIHDHNYPLRAYQFRAVPLFSRVATSTTKLCEPLVRENELPASLHSDQSLRLYGMIRF